MLGTSHKFIRSSALVALLLSAAQVDATPQIKTPLSPTKPQPIRLHPKDPHYFLFHGKAIALSPGDYSSEWLNVVTGKIDQLEKFTHNGGIKTLQSPAFQNGITLRLTRTPSQLR